MVISNRLLEELARRLDVVSAAGRAALEQIAINAPTAANVVELSAYIRENYPQIVNECTSNAAALGIEAYNTYRKLQTGEELEGVTMYPGYNERIVNRVCDDAAQKAAEEEDIAIVSEMMGHYMDSAIMHAYHNTQVQAARRDHMKPKFARVPMGINPCKFCMMLGSRGFVYINAQTAGIYEKYHNFCRCQIVPQFDAKGRPAQIEGYDPGKLYDNYLNGDYGFIGQKRQNHIKPISKTPKIDKPLSINPKEENLPASAYGGEWSQKDDMQTFLRTVFDKNEYVGTCADFFTDEKGRRVPGRGMYQRTAGYIEGVLDRTKNVSSAVGRYKTETGAFVRINPLDGKGITDKNVSSFKYALVEADEGSMEAQYGYIKALNLPTKAVVTSGGKSVHALVMVDAGNVEEYRERVSILQAECKAAGYNVDAAVKNPSRYMRIPGVKRGNGRQVLVSTNEGAGSWNEWREWCEENRED